jgi:hypothetical protein
VTRHKQLLRVLKKLPSDFEPWGKRPDAERGADCSCGCKWFHVLVDTRDGLVSLDWGVCVNPRSPRAGLLTFEHQGCPFYVEGDSGEATTLICNSDTGELVYPKGFEDTSRDLLKRGRL